MKNQKGFGLIQVIIAAALFSALSLAMATLIVDQKKAVHHLEDQLEKVQLMRVLETILSNGDACQKTFETITVPAVGDKIVLTNIKDHNGDVKYESNTTLRSLQLDNIELINDSIPGPDSSGQATLRVNVSRLRKGGGPSEFKPYDTTVLLATDSSSIITSCTIPSIGQIDWPSCVVETGEVDSGESLDVVCATDFYMVTGFCNRGGSEDHSSSHCVMLPDGIRITGDDDRWYASIKCCPTF